MIHHVPWQKIFYFFSFFGATVSVMVANYGFHVLAARGLLVHDYGVLSALFALFGFVAFGSMSLQNKCVELGARFQGNSNDFRTLMIRWVSKATLISAFITIALCLSSQLLSVWFHTQVSIILGFSFVFLFTLGLSAIRGFLQGRTRYYDVSISFFLESVLKCFLAWWLLDQGYGLNGLILALIISQIPSFSFGMLRLMFLKPEGIKNDALPKNPVPFWSMMLYFGLFSLWFNADMMLFQRFNPESAGAYSIASKMSQILLFCMTNVANYLFPYWIENHKKQESLWMIHHGRALAGLGGITGSIILFFTGSFWVTYIFGPQYNNALVMMTWLTIYVFLIGMIHYQMQHLFARGNYKTVYILTLLTLFWFISMLISLNTFPESFFWIHLIFSFSGLVAVHTFYDKKSLHQ